MADPAEIMLPALPAAVIAEVVAPPAAAPAAEPASAPPRPTAPSTRPRPVATRRQPSGLLEFAAWRLLELVGTVGGAALLLRLLLPSEGSIDVIVLLERLAVTGPLIGMSLVVAGLVGLPLGYLTGRGPAWLDMSFRALAMAGESLSPIWLAMLLIMLLAGVLGWMPPAGFVPWAQNPLGSLQSLVLPALALGLPLAAQLALILRAALQRAVADPRIAAAEVRGATHREAIRTHALAPAWIATIRDLALPLALLAPASLVIENVFYLPGLGRMLFDALAEGDRASLQLALLALVGLVALCRFLVEMLRAAADPRLAARA